MVSQKVASCAQKLDRFGRSVSRLRNLHMAGLHIKNLIIWMFFVDSPHLPPYLSGKTAPGTARKTRYLLHAPLAS
jgi:hypothetical protein